MKKVEPNAMYTHIVDHLKKTAAPTLSGWRPKRFCNESCSAGDSSGLGSNDSLKLNIVAKVIEEIAISGTKKKICTEVKEG